MVGEELFSTVLNLDIAINQIWDTVQDSLLSFGSLKSSNALRFGCKPVFKLCGSAR